MTLKFDRVFLLGVSFAAATALVAPVAAQETRERPRDAAATAAQETREATGETRQAAERSGNAITDSWITMKVHSQFVPEDALEDSDIDVETNAGVVTLTGTVATAAGKSRAVAIAKATDGVTRVDDRLRIAPEDDDRDDVAAAARPGAAGTTAGAAAREGARETREAGRRTGNAVSDGWLTSKIYAQYITEDALEDSDVDVDVEKGVVTLTGTVKTQAGATRAADIAQKTDGVKSVKNNITVKPSR